MENSTFQAIRARRATKKFARTEIDEKLLLELLELANRAPSGFNLQPWHFIIVRDANMKKLISHIAMNQTQVVDAAATVVFVANPRAWSEEYHKLLALGEESGTMTEEHRAFYRKNVDLLFKTGPVGIFGFMKKLGVPFMRLFKPIPHLLQRRPRPKRMFALILCLRRVLL